MLNKTIKYFRTSHKMTQETLALKLGVTRQTVSKWEKGISVPDADTLNKIADIFDVSVIDLLGSSELLDENKTEKSDSNKEIESKDFDKDPVVELLADLNEELAVKNKQRKKIIKIVKIVLIVIVVLMSIPIQYSLFWMYIAATM